MGLLNASVKDSNMPTKGGVEYIRNIMNIAKKEKEDKKRKEQEEENKLKTEYEYKIKKTTLEISEILCPYIYKMIEYLAKDNKNTFYFGTTSIETILCEPEYKDICEVTPKDYEKLNEYVNIVKTFNPYFSYTSYNKYELLIMNMFNHFKESPYFEGFNIELEHKINGIIFSW